MSDNRYSVNLNQPSGPHHLAYFSRGDSLRYLISVIPLATQRPAPEGVHCADGSALPHLRTSRRAILTWLLVSIAISIGWGYSIEASKDAGLEDFAAVYYGARTVMDHHDPYRSGEYLEVYRREGGPLPRNNSQPSFWRVVPVCVNLPPTLLVVAPLALLGWGPAHLMWMLLMPAGLLIAAWLALDLAADFGATMSLPLLCIVLANCEFLFQLGNATGIAVSLGVFAVWSFLRNRCVPAGIVCFGLGMALKPQEIGLIWLYFLLAGRVYRRRALASIGIAGGLAAVSLLWIATVSPHWVQEWHANVAATSMRGDLNDPGPSSVGNMNLGMTTDLQSVLSYVKDDPGFYNPAALLVCAPLLLAWLVVTVRGRSSRPEALLGVASMAALSMLPIYHRQYDLKILMLLIPACALLCTKGRNLRITALLVTAAAIVLTSDIPVALLMLLNKSLRLPQDEALGKIASVLTARCPTIVLLAAGVFYLWMYAGYAKRSAREPEGAG